MTLIVGASLTLFTVALTFKFFDVFEPFSELVATTLIEKNSSGFEHTTYGADLDGDGKLELYVAADEQGELNQYVWNGSGFTKNKIGDIPKRTFTWNITVGQF